ncbi:MAG: histidine phosphatase family protein [bacterium]|nr:histidine phosphatase family protein [bacterium]MCP5068287.1 histidine phosphatase family protein [bacterium]
MPIRRLILVRHGETDGESSIRYHGSTDVGLSVEGRAQMGRVAGELRNEPADLFVASTLKRSWAGAAIVSRGAHIRIEADLREIHFGRWEGLTRAEIQAQDPVLFEDWQAGAAGFEYPGGELRSDFQARIGRALERIASNHGHTAIAILHKGVICEIVRQLTSQAPAAGQPEIGARIVLTRRSGNAWHLGQRSTNPHDPNQQLTV